MCVSSREWDELRREILHVRRQCNMKTVKRHSDFGRHIPLSDCFVGTEQRIEDDADSAATTTIDTALRI